jgi:DNA polymerase III alpha subunit
VRHDGSTIILFAQECGGYANLCKLIATGRVRSEKGESAVTCNDVSTYDVVETFCQGDLFLFAFQLLTHSVEKNWIATQLAAVSQACA